MSHEKRLSRLGLSHLADNPEALRAETERRIRDYDQPQQPAEPKPETPPAT